MNKPYHITLPADRARELFKPSKDAESSVSIETKLRYFEFELFWSDVTAGVGQGYFNDVIGS